MPASPTRHERELTRALYRLYNAYEAAVCAAYARAEATGKAFRKSGDFTLSSEAYAKALIARGLAEGWLDHATGRA